jgi:hypothetical protein
MSEKEKEKEKILKKIGKIRARLLAKKKRLGWFDDVKGSRYIVVELYVKIQDYKNGSNYLNWFHRSFPGDIGFPEFLFESLIIRYKTKKIAMAQMLAEQTYFANTYIFDEYFGRPKVPVERYLNSKTATFNWLSNFPYKSNQEDLEDFSEWLDDYLKTDRFVSVKNQILQFEDQLKNLPLGIKRDQVLDSLMKLANFS